LFTGELESDVVPRVAPALAHCSGWGWGHEPETCHVAVQLALKLRLRRAIGNAPLWPAAAPSRRWPFVVCSSRQSLAGSAPYRRRTGARAECSVISMPDLFTLTHRAEVTSLAARYCLPAIYPFLEYTEVGGLLSDGNDIIDSYRRAASYVDRILKGAKPSKLPVATHARFCCGA